MLTFKGPWAYSDKYEMFVKLPSSPSGRITLAVKDDGRFAYEFFYNKQGEVKQKLQVKNWTEEQSVESDGRYAHLIPFSSIESVDLATEPSGFAHIAEVRVVAENGWIDDYEANNVRKLARPLRKNDRIQIRGKLILEEVKFPISINLLHRRSAWNSAKSRQKKREIYNKIK